PLLVLIEHRRRFEEVLQGVPGPLQRGDAFQIRQHFLGHAAFVGSAEERVGVAQRDSAIANQGSTLCPGFMVPSDARKLSIWLRWASASSFSRSTFSAPAMTIATIWLRSSTWALSRSWAICSWARWIMAWAS